MKKEIEAFLRVTMSDVLVSSYQTGGTGHADVVPIDQVSLNFAKIEVEYKEQDATGKLMGSIKNWFDLKSVKGG